MAKSSSVSDFVEAWFANLTGTKGVFFSRPTISFELTRSLLLRYRKELILKPVVKCNQ